jgi:UDP-N-acetylmuramyl pentapeptide phosphotransferase/UDP-N-acetylglucosamine-1-phosphate transferase/O-antigen ligase
VQASLSFAAAVAFAATLLLCVAVLATQKLHGHLTLDGTVGVQKFHTSPTPRIGGIALFGGLFGACVLAPSGVGAVFAPMLLAVIPAFAAGFAEDLTKRVSVLDRLLATIASGVLACLVTGYTLQHSGIVTIDALLAWTPLAIAVTALCVGGLANAINIIDGFNGLAAGVVVIALGAMGAIAAQLGDTALAATCVLVAAGVAGFLLVNFPSGKMFLGDGGAYLLGFLLGWIAVSLVARNPQLSPWAPLLACAYPVIEVAFSVYRKSRRAGSSPGQPDRVHLHMLVHRRIVRTRLHIPAGWASNAATSPFAWSYALAIGAWAAFFFRETTSLLAGLALAAAGYGLVYTRLSKFRWWPFAATRAARPAPAALARSGGFVMFPGEPRPLRDPLPRARSAPAPHVPLRWMYLLLGASSCIAIVEPAPFELIALLLMLLYAGQNLARAPWWSRVRPFTAVMLALLIVFCVLQLVPVALQARAPAASALYAGVTTMLVMIGVHLAQLHSRGDVRFFDFLAGYCAAALVSAALAIATFMPAFPAAAADVLLWAGRPKVFFKDPNVFGPYLVPAVLLFLHAAARRRGAATFVFVAMALVCAAGVVASASRAAWFNLAVALVAYALFSPPRHKAIVALAAVAVACAAIPVAAWLLGTGQDAFDLYAGRMQLQEYDTERFAMQQGAFDIGLRYPVGVGPGEIAPYLGFGPGMDPHNTYLRIWAENGPVALLLFAALLATLAAHAAQEFIARRANAAFVCALALLAGALVNATVVDMLHWRHFWVLLAICLFSFHGAGRPAILPVRRLAS